MRRINALRAVFRAFGWDVELSKRKVGKLANVVLGVMVSLARILSDGVAVVSPPSRGATLCHMGRDGASRVDGGRARRGRVDP